MRADDGHAFALFVWTMSAAAKDESVCTNSNLGDVSNSDPFVVGASLVTKLSITQLFDDWIVPKESRCVAPGTAVIFLNLFVQHCQFANRSMAIT